MCLSLIERLEDVGLYFQMLIKVKRKKTTIGVSKSLPVIQYLIIN